MAASATRMRSRDEARENSMADGVRNEADDQEIAFPRLDGLPIVPFLNSRDSALAIAVQKSVDDNVERENYAAFGSIIEDQRD
jgi:hypothetical protein